MSLFLATILFAVLLLLMGLPLLVGTPSIGQFLLKSLRNPVLTYTAMFVATAWFLYKVLHWGAADYGAYKYHFFVFFLLLALASLYFVPDFLSIRAVSIVYLLAAREFLDAAFLQDPQSRLFMVTMVYVFILIAMYMVAVPFKMRDLLEWLFEKAWRARMLGGLLTAYSILLAVVAFGY